MNSRPYLKVLEALIVAIVSAVAALLMMISLNDCKPLGLDPTKYPTQVRNFLQDYALLTLIAFVSFENELKKILIK